MKKNLIFIFITVLMTCCLTGCLKSDNMEDINVTTTIYPIEYVTNRLYGEHSTIKSIYPRDSVASSYKMTNKQLADYSEYDLFIYNGESGEREYATKMLNNNKNLKIIDAAYGLEAVYAESDIWLDPSNILMISRNIKNTLLDYIPYYLVEEIEGKYDLLKLDMTELETKLRTTADNAANTKIIVADESLNFLEKYGFDVINLTDNGKEHTSNIDVAKNLLYKNQLDYIFVMDHSKNYEIVNNLKTTYDVKTLSFRTLDTLSGDDLKNNDDYLSIMYNNIELLKKETYK